jgi:hypothetical protein
LGTSDEIVNRMGHGDKFFKSLQKNRTEKEVGRIKIFFPIRSVEDDNDLWAIL